MRENWGGGVLFWGMLNHYLLGLWDWDWDWGGLGWWIRADFLAG